MPTLSPKTPPDETALWSDGFGDDPYGMPLERSDMELEGPSSTVIAGMIGFGALLLLLALGLGYLLLGSDEQSLVSQPGDDAASGDPIGALQSDGVGDGADGSEAAGIADLDPQSPSTETSPPTTATTQALVIEDPSDSGSSDGSTPTTVAATAAPSTSAAPTSAVPPTSSTTAPTTAATEPPSTQAPATDPPTTAAPTTAPPSTPAPSTTAAPTTTAAPATAAPTTATAAPAPTGDDTAKQQAILALVNAERSNAGCGALTLQPQLNAAADAHSQDMADQVYFDHTGLDGSRPWDRAARAGYGGGFIGENIAQGYGTEASVMDGWMNSPGHRANILNCGYTHLGVGYASGQRPHYWTQLFGAGG